MSAEAEKASPEELRRAVLYLADAVLQLARTVDLMAMRMRFIVHQSGADSSNFSELAAEARTSYHRVREAVDTLVRPDESDLTR
jgi:hypothetical protein